MSTTESLPSSETKQQQPRFKNLICVRCARKNTDESCYYEKYGWICACSSCGVRQNSCMFCDECNIWYQSDYQRPRQSEHSTESKVDDMATPQTHANKCKECGSIDGNTDSFARGLCKNCAIPCHGCGNINKNWFSFYCRTCEIKEHNEAVKERNKRIDNEAIEQHKAIALENTVVRFIKENGPIYLCRLCMKLNTQNKNAVCGECTCKACQLPLDKDHNNDECQRKLSEDLHELSNSYYDDDEANKSASQNDTENKGDDDGKTKSPKRKQPPQHLCRFCKKVNTHNVHAICDKCADSVCEHIMLRWDESDRLDYPCKRCDSTNDKEFERGHEYCRNCEETQSPKKTTDSCARCQLPMDENHTDEECDRKSKEDLYQLSNPVQDLHDADETETEDEGDDVRLSPKRQQLHHPTESVVVSAAS